jgi:hypothetical protein
MEKKVHHVHRSTSKGPKEMSFVMASKAHSIHPAEADIHPLRVSLLGLNPHTA